MATKLAFTMKLINPIASCDTYVYHYTTLDTALCHILKNGTLKLNSFSNVNDPRENKSWNIVACVRADLNLSLEQYDIMSAEISKLIKGNVKVFCSSMDRASAVNQWQPEALLDRGFARPSMWQHYAGRHNGVCLMFDRKKLDTAIKSQLDEAHLFARAVDYSDAGVLLTPRNDPFYVDLVRLQSPEECIKVLEDHTKRWLGPLFFRKLADWQGEQEYRWVYFDHNAADMYVKFNDALAGVVLGDGVLERYEESFLRHCAMYGAEIARLEWRNGFPAVISSGQPYISHKHLQSPPPGDR